MSKTKSTSLEAKIKAATKEYQAAVKAEEKAGKARAKAQEKMEKLQQKLPADPAPAPAQSDIPPGFGTQSA